MGETKLKNVSDLSDAEARKLLEEIVVGCIREGGAMTSNEIFEAIRNTLEEAGIDLTEIEPEDDDEDEDEDDP